MSVIDKFNVHPVDIFQQNVNIPDFDPTQAANIWFYLTVSVLYGHNHNHKTHQHNVSMNSAIVGTITND